MTILRKVSSTLASLEIWIVTAVVAACFLSGRLLPAAVVVISAFWLIRWVGKGHLSLRTPADWPVALLVVMMPVTLWVTALPEVTWPQVYRLLVGIGLFYTIINWTDSPVRLRNLVYAAVLAGFGLALFSMVSVAWTPNKLQFMPAALYRYFPVLVSDPVHRNVMAGSLVILAPIAFGMLLFAWKSFRWYQGAAIGIASLVMMGVLFLTQSRGGWMAFAAVLVLLAVMRWRWGWLTVIAGGVVVGVMSQIYGLARIIEGLTTNEAVGGLDGRLEIWSRAIFMVRDFPFTGIGMGSFGKVADLLYPFFSYEAGNIDHSHNLFLQVAVDLGIPGVIAWLGICLLVTLTAFQVYRDGRVRGNRWIAGLGAGLFCSQIALVIHGMVDAVTWGMVRSAPIVWGLWGLTFAAFFVTQKGYKNE